MLNSVGDSRGYHPKSLGALRKANEDRHQKALEQHRKGTRTTRLASVCLKLETFEIIEEMQDACPKHAPRGMVVDEAFSLIRELGLEGQLKSRIKKPYLRRSDYMKFSLDG